MSDRRIEGNQESGGLLRSTGVLHMEELIGSGLPLPLYSLSMYDAISKDSSRLQWLTNIFHPQDWYTSLHGPSWNCSVLKKVHHIIGSMCMWFRHKVLYLLSVEGWLTLVWGLRFNYRQLNHRYNKAPAKVLLRYWLEKVHLLVLSDPQICMISAFRALCHCSNRAEN